MSVDDLRQKMQVAIEESEAISAIVDATYAPLVRAAQGRLTEALAFVEIAAEARPPADKRLARLDAVMRETMTMAAKLIEFAGTQLRDGIAIEEVDEFLTRQEQSEAALDQARVAATAVIIHLDRVLQSVTRAQIFNKQL